MRALLFCLALAVCSVGCQSIQLRNHTARQARTLTDLEFRQVLDNLAMFADNPDTLPYFSVAGTGQTQIKQDLAANGGLRWTLFNVAGTATNFFFDQATAGSTATNSSTEQWTTGSSVYPEELYLMRCVYQKTIGRAACDCEDKLNAYFSATPERLAAMRPGWYGVGKKHQAPKHACYVGHHGHTCVWVLPEDVDSLTLVTLAILDIATIDPAAIPARLDPDGGQRRSNEDRLKLLIEMHNKLDDKKTAGAGELKGEIEKLLHNLYGGGRAATPSALPVTPLVPLRRNFFNPIMAPLGGSR